MTPFDNMVRKSMFLGCTSKKGGLFLLGVDCLGGEIIYKVNIRLRGIVPKRCIDSTGKDTYTIIEDRVKNGEEIMVKFYDKNNIEGIPFLVDIFLKDGTFLNEWLIENRYANKYRKQEKEKEEVNYNEK